LAANGFEVRHELLKIAWRHCKQKPIARRIRNHSPVNPLRIALVADPFTAPPGARFRKVDDQRLIGIADDHSGLPLIHDVLPHCGEVTGRRATETHLPLDLTFPQLITRRSSRPMAEFGVQAEGRGSWRSNSRRVPLSEFNWIGTVYHGLPLDLLSPQTRPPAVISHSRAGFRLRKVPTSPSESLELPWLAALR
jgi:hypothetical protein